MIVKTIKGAFDSPRRSYTISSEDYMGSGEEMMSSEQRHSLINLVLSKIQNKEDREKWLSQISDDLTSVDAEDMIFSLLMSK
jgi:hypothetical protein